MGDHAKRMDSSIGAAGAMKTRATGKQSGKGLLDFFLDADSCFLNLPALVGGTVVRDG